MRNIIKKITLLVIVLFAFVINVSAQEFPEPLKPARLVNDFCGILTKEQNNEIERVLRELNTTTSTQITIAIVPTIDQMDIAQYTTELAQKWRIGQEGKDNGIMIVIKPQGSSRKDKGMVYISVGYGLEGAVPDVTAKRIIRSEILPQFKKGRYFEGIYSCVNTLKGLVAGEYTADEYHKKESNGNMFGTIIIVIAAMVFLFLGTRSRANSMDISNGNNGNNQNSSSNSALLSFMQIALMMSLGRRSNGFDSFSGGSGSFGGGGDNLGDFGGFGGGDFGGGGAGGEW